MAVEITMPQLSDTMNEGTILTWLKKEGDRVGRGEALAEVATDKADLEIESFHEGTLLKIHSPVGTTVKVGSVIAVIGNAGDSISPASTNSTSIQSTGSQSQPTQQPVAAPVNSVQATGAVAFNHSSSQTHSSAPVDGERVKISPLARNLAQSFGVDYSGVQGSGDGGRIVKRDIEKQLGQTISQEQVTQAVEHKQPMSLPVAAKPTPAPIAPVVPSNPTTQRNIQSGQSTQVLSKMRQTIAARMVESVTTAPHFYVSGKIHADAFIKLRQTLKSLPQYENITFNHLVIKAAAMALKAVPRINGYFENNSLVQPNSINIGVITALEDGLLIPVIKGADSLPLADIVSEANSLVQRARSGRPKADDLQGGTFSISNIGKAEVENFTAIINPGQGAILAVSSIQEEPVVDGGAIRVGNVMRVTLSVDHRIIDGVLAGQFITELKRILEEPVLLLA